MPLSNSWEKCLSNSLMRTSYRYLKRKIHHTCLVHRKHFWRGGQRYLRINNSRNECFQSICIIWTFVTLEKVSVFLHQDRKNLARWNFAPKSIRFSRAVCTHQRGSRVSLLLFHLESAEWIPGEDSSWRKRRVWWHQPPWTKITQVSTVDFCQVLHTQKYICITWPHTHTRIPFPVSISKIFKRCLEQVIRVLLQKGSKTDQEYFNMCSLADPWNCIFKSSLADIFTNFPRHKL